MNCFLNRCLISFYLILGVLFIAGCDDDDKTPNYYNGSLPVCKPDWITNPKYHLVEPYKPVVNSPNSLKALVNGKSWVADGGTHCTFYSYPVISYPWCYPPFESNLSIGGTDGDKEYGISIHLYNFNKPDERYDISIQPYNFSAYSISKLNSNFTLLGLDTIKKVVNAKFSASFRIKSYDPVNEFNVVVTDGTITNMKIEDLFCKPSYAIRQEDLPVTGEWKLIEISDCYHQRIFYPPIDMEITMDITNEPNITPDEHLYGDFYLKLFAINICSLTYKFISDSTIVISNGGSTQVGSTWPEMDFERLYFQTMAVDTFIVRKNNNLLELKKDNLYLRFYK